MRLVRVHASLNPANGGIVSSLLATSSALARDHDVCILTRDEDQAHHAPFVAAGVEVLVLRRRARGWQDALEGAALVLIEGAWSRMAMRARRWSRRLDIPLIYVPHGSLSRLVRQQFPWRHMKKLAYWCVVENHIIRSSAMTWYSSDAERGLSAGTFPGTPSGSAVIPFASRAVRGDRVRHTSPPLQLMTATRVVPVKDLHIVIRALANPQVVGWHLTIAGDEDPGHAAELRQLADDLGVADRISWLGFLDTDELDALYLSSDAYVCPGLESFGMSVAEALSSNLPVIASDAVALAPVIGEAGAVFPRGDVDALAREIGAVSARLTGEGFGDAPAQVWREHCSPENFLRAFSAAMDPVLG